MPGVLLSILTDGISFFSNEGTDSSPLSDPFMMPILEILFF